MTGSKYLVEAAGKRLLIDCGIFQGLRELTERNYHPLSIDPQTIDYVVLTHAHLDHTGWLPVLVKGVVQPDDIRQSLAAGAAALLRRKAEVTAPMTVQLALQVQALRESGYDVKGAAVYFTDHQVRVPPPPRPRRRGAR